MKRLKISGISNHLNLFAFNKVILNLRTENQQLRTTLKNKENYEFALEDKYQDSKYNLSNVNFEKEKELL